MTTIETILGKCFHRVMFDHNKSGRLPIRCYGCDGYRHTAEKNQCENYTPYLDRHNHDKSTKDLTGIKDTRQVGDMAEVPHTHDTLGDSERLLCPNVQAKRRCLENDTCKR